jgi:hypothetical protein
MKLSKLNLKGQDNILNIVLGLGLIIIIVLLFQYNKKKSTLYDNMQPLQYSQVEEKNGVAAASPSDSSYMQVSGVKTTTPQSACTTPSMVDPTELLPKDNNSEWANVNPASNDLKNVNMLNADQLIGINTVGSSLRNANYQVRSEPANPRVNVGPWMASTIDADSFRRPLEIGGCD